MFHFSSNWRIWLDFGRKFYRQMSKTLEDLPLSVEHDYANTSNTHRSKWVNGILKSPSFLVPQSSSSSSTSLFNENHYAFGVKKVNRSEITAKFYVLLLLRLEFICFLKAKQNHWTPAFSKNFVSSQHQKNFRKKRFYFIKQSANSN